MVCFTLSVEKVEGLMLLINLVVVFTMMFLLWLVSLVRRDVSIIDPVWGLGFIVVAWATCIQSWPVSSRMILVTVLVTIWGLRLSGYLFWRSIGEPEDARYAAMRKHHGDRFWWVSLITVFGLQAFLLWLIAFPIQFVGFNADGASLGWLDVVGVMLWLVGFFFESVGDWQLARFRGDPNNRGKVLDSGLWRYTRHPNYFGDFLIYVSFALSGAWIWGIFSPIANLGQYFGDALPKNEKKSAERYGTLWSNYVSTTPVFVPMPFGGKKK